MSPPSPPSDSSDPPHFGAPLPGGGEFGYDPLVPPPAEGFQAAWDRFRLAVPRSAKPVMLIFLLTFALPQIAQSLLTATVADGIAVAGGGGLPVPADDLFSGIFATPSGGALLLSLALFVLTSLIAAVGWGAAIWAVTWGATGPVLVSDAFHGSLRRMVPMFGWYLIYLLLITLGFWLLVLPGVYIVIAGSLFSFVVMYEPGRSPLWHSIRLVHKAFLPVLGRVAALFGFALVAMCLVGFVLGSLIATVGTGTGAQTTLEVVLALVLVPVYAVLVIGLLLTYTQVRASQEPVSTDLLQAALPQAAEPPGYGGTGTGGTGFS